MILALTTEAAQIVTRKQGKVRQRSKGLRPDERAEEIARESFVLPGEEAAQALAEGTARRKALDAALAELDAGRDEPSVEWRREFSLMLGLERLLGDVRDRPRAVIESAENLRSRNGGILRLVEKHRHGDEQARVAVLELIGELARACGLPAVTESSGNCTMKSRTVVSGSIPTSLA